MSSNHASDKESDLSEVSTTDLNPFSIAKSRVSVAPSSVGPRTRYKARRRGPISPKKSSSKRKRSEAAVSNTVNPDHGSLTTIPTIPQLPQVTISDDDAEFDDDFFDENDELLDPGIKSSSQADSQTLINSTRTPITETIS